MVDILHPKLVYKSSIFVLEPDSFGTDSKLMREPVLEGTNLWGQTGFVSLFNLTLV